MAHEAFTDVPGARCRRWRRRWRRQHGWSLTDYRDVIRELKKKQITGDAILPFYKERLKAIEDIIVAKGW